MTSKKIFQLLAAVFVGLLIVAQPLFSVGQWRFDRVKAQQNDNVETDSTDISPEDQFADASPIDSLGELDPVLLVSPALSIAPQDVNNIRDGRVDVRVTDYLIYLVTPVEQGGAGFKHIKAQRILKNYDTDGVGRLDRETLAAIEEGESVVSAHNDGQAVDISEVGAITCKMVERRHLGGSTTKWQGAKAIKVAWQSRDGIQRNPTPKGPSMMEIASSMSAQSILMMLNESGEMDDFADYVMGLSLPDILQYVGANILLKNYGAGSLVADPMAAGIPEMLGAVLLQKYLPGLPDGLPIADTNQDVRIAVAKAYLESLLNLPNGSIRGNGWNGVLESTGMRTLENSLGMPALSLETKTMEEAFDNGTVKAAMGKFKNPDKAINLLPGTTALINAKNRDAYKWAGVNLLSDALRLSSEQRAKLNEAVKNGQTPDIKIEYTGTDRGIPDDVLNALLQQTGAEQKLKEFGQKYISQIINKAIPDQLSGFSRDIIGQLATSGTNVIYGELIREMGIKKIASDASTDPGKAQTAMIKPTERPNKYHGEVASNINDQLSLEGTPLVTAEEVKDMMGKKPGAVLSKVGGSQADKAIGWDPGTGYAIIQKEKTLEDGLQEKFNNSIGEIMGLPWGTDVSFDGDMYRNYGNALIESRLGLDVSGDGKSLNISTQFLYPAFGIKDSRDISDLSVDDSFWQRADVKRALEFTDIRLGVAIGTSESYLRAQIDNSEFSKKVAQANIKQIGKDQLINYLELEDNYKISNDDFALIVETISDWDNTDLEKRQQVIDMGKKLIGRTLDQRTTFERDIILNIARGDEDAAVKTLVQQGVRQFVGGLGVNIPSFEPRDYVLLEKFLTDAINDDLTKDQLGAYGYLAQDLLVKWGGDATGIPVADDVHSFLVDGNVRVGLESWSAAQMVKFAGIYLPSEQQLTYQEIRNSINFSDQAAINLRADQIIAESGATSLTEEQLFEYRAQARRELMQEARDGSKYKISDAFLRQAGVPIPIDFTKVMFDGTQEQRSEMLEGSVITFLDSELTKRSPSYVPGSLDRLYHGEITIADMNQVALNIVSGQAGPIGGLGVGFLANFYSYITATDRAVFLTDQRYDSMWGAMEGWFGSNLGISGLPSGFAKSVFLASENDWDFSASIPPDGSGKGGVQSVNDIGAALLEQRITQWADKALGLRTGDTYRLYKATNALTAAQRAGDASQITAAKCELTAIAITIALNACAACQQFFASVDQALAAPPGFTNAAVAGAIAMAFGLGPAGLIAAAAIYLFGVYKVDYLCPIPPPDRFAYQQFDNPNDAVHDYSHAYYTDPATPVKDSPAPGQNKFDWDDGVPFVDGNKPDLWMAWSRYFAGKLLDATMSYGANQQGAGKPLQVITYRQANVEFFAPRAAATFGPSEAGNDRLGLGFTQASTKTTDWVHAAFGGFF